MSTKITTNNGKIKQCELGASEATATLEAAEQLTNVLLETRHINSKISSDTEIDSVDFKQVLNEKLSELKSTKPLLSRKRRYLLFPEGCSFQVVYDLIIGVVDFTNYLILGITVALAWELPNKPPSEIIEDLQTVLNKGLPGIGRNDTATNITYVDTNTLAADNSGHMPNYTNSSSGTPADSARTGYNSYYKLHQIFQPPMSQKYYPNSKKNYFRHRPPFPPRPGWRRNDNNFYTKYKVSPKNPFNKWIKPESFKQKDGQSFNTSAYPWWKLNSLLSNSMRLRQEDYYYSRNKHNQQHESGQQELQFANAYHQSPRPTTTTEIPHQHRIYPVFGKRSFTDSTAQNEHNRLRRSGIAVNSELSKLDRIHIRHHRSTRQNLYDKIEKYLDKHNIHGQHCVLRALCETERKSHERVPGTFVGELMRVIFTLPEPLYNEPVAYKDTRYDQANQHNGDCSQTYHLCKQSMWDADFIK